MNNKVTIFDFLSFVLMGLGIGLTFLGVIKWYFGLIGILFSLVAFIFLLANKNKFNKDKFKFFLSFAITSIIVSCLLFATILINDYVVGTFEYDGQEYSYSSAIISLSVFVIMIGIFIWDKLPMATTAILGCSLMVVLDLCTFSTAFGQFASSTVILTIGVMILGAAISETGLAEFVGNWIIKISKGHEKILIIGTYLVSAVMSAFLTNSAVLAIFIPIIVGLSKTNSNIKVKNLIMPIAIGCVLGGASTLVGSTQQMTAQGLLEESGLKTFKTFDFLPVVGIIILIGLLYILLIGYKRGNKIWGNREQIENIDFKSSERSSQPKWKMMIVAGIFLTTVVLYITEWLPIAITSTLAALLCIITGTISQKKAIASVNWNIVGRLGGCLGLAKGLGVAGGTSLLSMGFVNVFGNAFSNLHPWWTAFILFAIFTLIVLVLSQFISNSTAILIVLPIIIIIAPELGLNTYAFALGTTIASGVALSCPLASSTLGISMVAGYKFNDYFKYSIFLDIISYTLILILVPLFFGLLV